MRAIIQKPAYDQKHLAFFFISNGWVCRERKDLQYLMGFCRLPDIRGGMEWILREGELDILNAKIVLGKI